MVSFSILSAFRARSRLRGDRVVRIGSKSEKRPPSAFPDGEKSRRWRAGADTPSPRLSQVSDILFTGGDPMIMKTNMLKQYLEPFKDPDHLPHIKNLRIGTRALTFWPQRFTTDPDADSLIELLRDVKEVGGRHIAIMSHLSHYRELSTKKVQDAIHRLKQEGGVIIRSQSPVMAGINDDARVWNKKWKEEVRDSASVSLNFST